MWLINRGLMVNAMRVIIEIESGIGYIKVSGTDVYTITTLSGISTISASATTNVAPGLYIVKAGNKVQKVIVK